MADDNLFDEQQIWFQLMGELGSKPNHGASEPAYTEPINEYQFLLTSYGETDQDIPMQDFASGSDQLPIDFLARSTMQPPPKTEFYSAEENNDMHSYDHGNYSTDVSNPLPAQEQNLSLSRFRTLQKYSDDVSSRDNAEEAWKDYYPGAYEAIKSALVFESQEEEPVTELATEGYFPSTPSTDRDGASNLALKYKPTGQAAESEVKSTGESLVVYKVCVPESPVAVVSTNSRNLPTTVAVHIASGFKASGALAVSTLVRTTRQISMIASYALLQFAKYLRENYYISSVVGCISEAHSAIQEQIDTIRNILQINMSGGSGIEQQHLQHIQHSIGWEMVFWRYSLSTLTWQQRQLLEETKDKYASDEVFLKNQLLKQDDIYRDEPTFRELLSLQAQAAEDIQYMLAKHFTPKPREESPVCYVCQRSFGLTLYQYHCSNCSKCVCDADSKGRRPIYRFGLTTPVRVCDSCCFEIDEVHRRDEIMWKDRRVKSYQQGKLIPYSYPRRQEATLTENVKEYSLLIARNALSLTVPSKAFFETAAILKRLGLTGFAGTMLQKDFMDSIETLKKMIGMDDMYQFSLHEMTACIYYKIAVNRGLRGCAPDSEQIVHMNTDAQMSLAAVTLLYDSVAQPHPEKLSEEAIKKAKRELAERNLQVDEKEKFRCVPANDADLAFAIKYAPLALNVIYEDDAVDLQRLASLQDLQLLFTHSPNSDCFTKYQLQYAFFAISNHIMSNDVNRCKEAILVLRSNNALETLVKAVHEDCVLFPPSVREVWNSLTGLRHDDNTNVQQDASYMSNLDNLYPHTEGYILPYILNAAFCILEEMGPSLLRLHTAGYHITLVGHSVAGAIVAVLNYLLLPIFNNNQSNTNSAYSTISSLSYGAPCCVNYEVAEYMKQYHLNIILHDDIVPRINKQSIHTLLQDIAKFRQHIFRHDVQDWREVMKRATEIWRPILRPNQPADGMMDENTGDSMLDQLQSSPATMLGVSTNNAQKSKFLISYVSDAVLIDTEDKYNTYCVGKLLHIYSHRGQYHTVEVSNNFPEIRKISVQNNMFTDHSNVDILHALLEARAVRKAPQAPPFWVAYNSSMLCQNCQNTFTWHSNFKGTLEEYRERYNCFSCGSLVCGPCSKQERCIHKYGMIFPKRVCDKCILKGDFADI